MSAVAVSPTSGDRVKRRAMVGRTSVASTNLPRLPVDVEQQHLCDEIHAVPPLFAKIRNHRHARQFQCSNDSHPETDVHDLKLVDAINVRRHRDSSQFSC